MFRGHVIARRVFVVVLASVWWILQSLFLFTIKLNNFALIKWSYKCPPPLPPIKLILEPRMMISIFEDSNSPISFRHMSFLYPFLEPHQPHTTQIQVSKIEKYLNHTCLS